MGVELTHRDAVRRYNFGRLIFWAQDGHIVIKSRADNVTMMKSVAYMKAFIRAAKEILRRRNRSECCAQQKDWWRQQLQFLHDAEECVAEARRQGDPYDPAVRAFRERHRRNWKELPPQSHYGLRRLPLTRDDQLALPAEPEGTNIRLDAPVPTFYTPPRKRGTISLPY